MATTKRHHSFLPETWPATILFIFHAPLMLLLTSIAQLRFMETLSQLILDERVNSLKNSKWDEILFYSKCYCLRKTRHINPGSQFKDIPLVALDGTQTNLQKYVKDLPLVLNFGNLAQGSFVASIPEYNDLVEFYKESVQFLTVYTREIHSVGREDTHTSLEDRIEKGKQLKEDMAMRGEIIVDDMDDSGSRMWGAQAELWAVVRPDGIIEDIADMGPWGYDLERLDNVLSRLMKKE